MDNEIPGVQNGRDALRLLAAQRQFYMEAKGWSVLQLSLVLAIPLLSLVLTPLFPDLKPWAALAGILVLISDVMFIEPAIRRKRSGAACAQELFDTTVLSIPWNPWLTNERPDLEDLQAAERRLASRKGGLTVQALKDWYPASVGDLRLELARVICQRANTRWDSQLRRWYATGISLAVLVAIAAILFVGLARDMSLEDVLLVTIAPSLPAIMWAIRERVKHLQAADNVDRLKSMGTTLWNAAVGGLCPADECAAQSRQFQDAIFQHRKSSPFVFEWMYWLCRDTLEMRMQESTEDMVAQAKARAASTVSSPPA
jgi:hypothetical protein